MGQATFIEIAGEVFQTGIIERIYTSPGKPWLLLLVTIKGETITLELDSKDTAKKELANASRYLRTL